MKLKILLVLFVFPSLLFAQGKYVIKGKLRTFNPPAKVYLLLYNAGMANVTDSTTIKDGLFEFNGQVSEISLAVLIMDEKGLSMRSAGFGNQNQTVPFFLEQGDIIVSTDEFLSKAKVSGTVANDEYMLYKVAIQPVADALKKLENEYNSATEERKQSQAFADDLAKQQGAIQQQAKMIRTQFINTHPDAYISLQTLINGMNESYPDTEYLFVQFSKLSARLRRSKKGVELKGRLDKVQAVAIGAIAPDFMQPDTNGTAVKLSSFRGKYVLLDFWASWCVPCRNQSPELVKAYNAFKTKNFTILSVSLDRPGGKEDWLKAIHADGLVWPQVSDLKFQENDAAALYSVKSIPHNLLIDPDGKIIAKNLFGEALQIKLAELLGSSI